MRNGDIFAVRPGFLSDDSFLINMCNHTLRITNFTKKLADVTIEQVQAQRNGEVPVLVFSISYLSMSPNKFCHFGIEQGGRAPLDIRWSVLTLNAKTGMLRILVMINDRDEARFYLGEHTVIEWACWLTGDALDTGAIDKWVNLVVGLLHLDGKAASEVKCKASLQEAEISIMEHIPSIHNKLQELETSDLYNDALVFKDEETISTIDNLLKLERQAPVIKQDYFGNKIIYFGGDYLRSLEEGDKRLNYPTETVVDLQYVDGSTAICYGAKTGLAFNLKSYLEKKSEQYGSLREAWNQTVYLTNLFCSEKVKAISVFYTNMHFFERLLTVLGTDLLYQLSNTAAYNINLHQVTGPMRYALSPNYIPVFALSKSDYESNEEEFIKNLLKLQDYREKGIIFCLDLYDESEHSILEQEFQEKMCIERVGYTITPAKGTARTLVSTERRKQEFIGTTVTNGKIATTTFEMKNGKLIRHNNSRWATIDTL